MRFLKSIGAALCMCSLIFATACTTTTTGPPPNVAAADAIAERAAQGMLGAELAFNVLTVTVESLVDAGVLTGERAAIVRQHYQTAHRALLAARAAYTLGRYAETVTRSQEATAAIQAINAVLARPPTP